MEERDPGRTAPSSDGLLAERPMLGGLCTAPGITSLSLAIDVTLGASGLWLGTQRGAGSTVTLA